MSIISRLETTVDSLRESASRARALRTSEVERFKRDSKMSDSYRKERIEQTNAELRATLQDLERKETEAAETALLALHRTLNGNMFSGADIIAARDAEDRASRLKSEKEALNMLDRATRTSDTSLAQSIMRVAIHNNWESCVDAFVSANPNHQETAESIARVGVFLHDPEATLQRSFAYSTTH